MHANKVESTIRASLRRVAPEWAKSVRRRLRYEWKLRTQPRQNRVYSQFYRFPHQYRVLVERVLPSLLAREERAGDAAIDILMFACCRGEEPYTLASTLRTHFPDLEFTIHAFDIVPEAVERAVAATYTPDEVTTGPFVTEAFVAATFDRDGSDYVVKPEIRSHVRCAVGDMTDSSFMAGLPLAELVYAQNVLFHLPRPVAAEVFEGLVGRLKPGGTMFVNGMDTDMRIRLTKKFALAPEQFLLREVHEDARVDRGPNWSGSYWGRAPFSKRSKDWSRKYGTVFTKSR